MSFLHGIDPDPIAKLFESSEEQLTPVEGKVTGIIPPCINGTFLRVGPGKFDFNSGYTLNHYFDGYALLSKYSIRGGSCSSVTYESKYLNTDAYNKAAAAGKSMCNEFGSKSEQDMGKTYFQKMCRMASLIMVPNLTDNCNYALFTHENDTFVIGETSSFHELNVTSLSSLCRHDMPKYFGFYQFTPHPLRDHKTGDIYNIGTSVKTGLKYNLVRIPPKQGNISAKEHFKKNLKIVATIPSRWNTWLGCAHSFAMSENYAIFVEQPHILNVGRYIANGLVRNEAYRLWLEWHPEYPNRFYVINKRTGKILSTEFISSKVFYFIHIINSYEDEENQELVLDISTYDDPSILDNQFIKKLRSECSFYSEEFQASITRFVIPLKPLDPAIPEGTNLVVNHHGHATRKDKTIIIHGEEIARKGLEMITFNNLYVGRPYSFVYGTSLTAHSSFTKSVVKVNLETKETLCWTAGENMIFGEVMLVPVNNECNKYWNMRTNNNNNNNGMEFDTEEDEGYLIVPSMDIRTGYPDYMYFLNAKTMEEVGRVTFNMRIPPAFHGHFLSN